MEVSKKLGPEDSPQKEGFYCKGTEEMDPQFTETAS